MSREQTFKQRCYPEAQFGGFSDHDGAVRFYSRVNALLSPDTVVLDIGCGRGAYASDTVAYRRNLRIFRGKCRHVIGIDVDPAGQENPFLDEFRAISGDRWPLPDRSVDLAVADYVLEHVTDPDRFFAECARVLNVGGMLCLRTPNRWGYVALAAQCIPNRLHAAVLKRLGKSRGAEDVFPTVYRCNTRGRIRRVMTQHQFDVHVSSYEDEPTYFMFSQTAYALGTWWRPLVPPMFRGNLFVFGRKREKAVAEIRKAA
jgi:SAM-dependent methyltransferase